jgi:hypothetical protein
VLHIYEERPYRDSNPDQPLRRRLLYPLSYKDNPLPCKDHGRGITRHAGMPVEAGASKPRLPSVLHSHVYQLWCRYTGRRGHLPRLSLFHGAPVPYYACFRGVQLPDQPTVPGLVKRGADQPACR